MGAFLTLLINLSFPTLGNLIKKFRNLSNPHPLPALPPHGVYIDRCIISRSGSSTVISKNSSSRVITWECVLCFAPYMKAFLLKDHQSLKWKSIFGGHIVGCTDLNISFLQLFLTCYCHQLTQNSLHLYFNSSGKGLKFTCFIVVVVVVFLAWWNIPVQLCFWLPIMGWIFTKYGKRWYIGWSRGSVSCSKSLWNCHPCYQQPWWWNSCPSRTRCCWANPPCVGTHTWVTLC